jgi:hypothetical protein
VCASLLYRLNLSGGSKTKFVVSDQHPNITACALPEWLPGEIVYSMVVEFSRRLRDELIILQNNASNYIARGHRRTKSSDTGRLSMSSVLSDDAESDPEKMEKVKAFSAEQEATGNAD